MISACGRYRYLLARVWDDELPLCAFIQLSPSKADAEVDEAPVRRNTGFSRRWGYGGFRQGNLFALRSTDPRILAKDPSPLGPENLITVERELINNPQVKRLVAAWGNLPKRLQPKADKALW